MARAIDIIRQVAPKADPDYFAAFESGDALLQQHGLTTRVRLAHFLAQVLHESGGLTLQHESMKDRMARLVDIFGVGRHSAMGADALNVIGANPPIEVDGEYEPITREAILQFQKAHDLMPDGWAGDLTQAALQLALSEKRTVGGEPLPT